MSCGIAFRLPTEGAVWYSPVTMQRGTAVVVGALMMLLIAALVLKGGRRSLITEAPRTDGGLEVSSSTEGGITDDPLLVGAFPALDGGGQFTPPPPSSDAEPSAALPTGSPKMVRFGVILVQYRGAQTAPASSRSKDDAIALARSLAEAAKTDFRSQVLKGDQGSMEDAGRIPRGVLEPAIEYVLFTMSSGSVSDPIDTPRGFWIVKRLD